MGEGLLPRGFSTARNFQGGLAHFFVDEAVGGENERPAKLIRLAHEIADFAAGFFDEKNACGDVPLVETEFPEGVEAARSDAGEIEGGGTVAADAVRALGEFPVVLEIRAELAVARGKSGAKQTCGQRGDFGDGDFFAVTRCAFAARGGVELVVERIENYGSEERVALGKGDGNGEAGIVVREICSAVERVDIPAKFGSGVLPGAFFGGDGVAGEKLVDAGDDELFGALVGLRDDVHLVAFVANVERPGELLHEDLSGFLSDLDGSLEVVFGHDENSNGLRGPSPMLCVKKWPLEALGKRVASAGAWPVNRVP